MSNLEDTSGEDDVLMHKRYNLAGDHEKDVHEFRAVHFFVFEADVGLVSHKAKKGCAVSTYFFTTAILRNFNRSMS